MSNNLDFDGFIYDVSNTVVTDAINIVTTESQEESSDFFNAIKTANEFQSVYESVQNEISGIVNNSIADFEFDDLINNIISISAIEGFSKFIFGVIERPFIILEELFNVFWDPLASFITNSVINRDFFYYSINGVPNEQIPVSFTDIRKNVLPGTLYERPLTKHPLFPSEPDIHRVCRGDKTVYEPGGMKYNFDKERDPLLLEPPMEYNPTYPYNHYSETEAGHIFEYDDTPSYERIQERHCSGTGYHVNPDGTKQTSVVGDDFKVVFRDNKAHIFGRLELYVDKEAEISINGNAKINVGRDAVIHARRDIWLRALRDINLQAGRHITLEADTNKEDEYIGRISLNSLTHIPPMSDYVPPVIVPLYPEQGPHEMTVPPMAEQFMLNHEGIPDALTTISSGAVKTGMSRGQLGSEEWVNRQPDIVLHKEEDNSGGGGGGGGTPITGNDLGGFLSGDIGNLRDPANPIYDLQISKHCYVRDLTLSCYYPHYLRDSQCGLSLFQILANLARLAATAVDPLYEKYGGFVNNTYDRPKGRMRITSGLRKPSTCRSWHEKGCAFDMQLVGVGKGYYYDEAVWAKQNISGFDHILLEYKTTGSRLPWIHIGVTGASRGLTKTFMNHTVHHNTKFVNLLHKNKPIEQKHHKVEV
jgi:hypothetical protein